MVCPHFVPPLPSLRLRSSVRNRIIPRPRRQKRGRGSFSSESPGKIPGTRYIRFRGGARFLRYLGVQRFLRASIGVQSKQKKQHQQNMKLITILALSLATVAFGEDTKFAGDAMCAKCALKQVDECQMAIKVKDAAGKEETLLVENNDVSKDFHKNICKQTKAVNGEGTIAEKDGKKTITLTKIYLSK